VRWTDDLAYGLQKFAPILGEDVDDFFSLRMLAQREIRPPLAFDGPAFCRPRVADDAKLRELFPHPLGNRLLDYERPQWRRCMHRRHKHLLFATCGLDEPNRIDVAVFIEYGLGHPRHAAKQSFLRYGHRACSSCSIHTSRCPATVASTFDMRALVSGHFRVTACRHHVAPRCRYFRLRQALLHVSACGRRDWNGFPQPAQVRS
jgi:hypothetical protein